jgi:hypothetical protein
MKATSVRCWPKGKIDKLHAMQVRRNVLHVTASENPMASTHVNARVQKHRDALRRAGLRPVQIWVPDTRRPDFVRQCRRQSRLAARADAKDAGMQHFLDAALADVDGWAP